MPDGATSWNVQEPLVMFFLYQLALIVVPPDVHDPVVFWTKYAPELTLTTVQAAYECEVAKALTLV
jgi:hypothetical protein